MNQHMNPLFKQASKPCCLMTPSFPFIKFGRSRIEKISHLFDQEKEKKKKKKKNGREVTAIPRAQRVPAGSYK